MKTKWMLAIGFCIAGYCVAVNCAELTTLSDDFSNADTIKEWKVHNSDQLKILVVEDGKLVLEPDPKVGSIAWYMDGTGPFVYKQITGKFVAEIQLKVSSIKDHNRAPYGAFNSAGFVVRDPASNNGNQNWIMYNIGQQDMGFGREAKTTENSGSALSIYAAPAKYNSGKLRVCRIGSMFYMYHWLENETKWIAEDIEQFKREDLPQVVDVGMVINAYDTPREIRAEFDYIKFSSVDYKADCIK